MARAQRRNSSSISSSRPTKGVSADPRNASNRLATTLGRSTCQDRHRPSEALDLDSAQIAVLEEIADQPARARGDNDHVRLGQSLQTGGQVRRFADDRLLLRRAFADQIADDHQPGGDPDARLELYGFDIEATDRVDDTQPRPDRPLGIVLMRSRVAEIDENAVAHVLGDKAIEPGDDFGDRAMICSDDLAQILGIEPRGELRSSRPGHRTSP